VLATAPYNLPTSLTVQGLTLLMFRVCVCVCVLVISSLMSESLAGRNDFNDFVVIFVLLCVAIVIAVIVLIVLW